MPDIKVQDANAMSDSDPQKSGEMDHSVEEKIEYPLRKVVMPVMLAIALAIFLVALVRCFLPPMSRQFALTHLDRTNDSWDCHTVHHKRVQ